MTQFSFISRLNEVYTSRDSSQEGAGLLSTLAWITPALLQDRLVWENLQDSVFGEQALSKSEKDPSAWSPASLGLLAINLDTGDSGLAAASLRDMRLAIDNGLRRRAARLYETTHRSLAAGRLAGGSSQPAMQRLAQAALLALALRERRRLTGVWDGLLAELKIQPDAEGRSAAAWRTPLACLYGMISDPADLLKALVVPEVNGYFYPARFSLALHALLSNPLPPAEQSAQLHSLLDPLPLKDQLSCLEGLAALRPALAGTLAGQLLDAQVDPQAELPDQSYHSGSLDGPSASLERLYQVAGLHRLAGRPAEQFEALSKARRYADLLQAGLENALAQAAASKGDSAGALEYWRAAVSLVPNSAYLQASLVLAKLDAGKTGEADACLSTSDPQTARPASGAAPWEDHLVGWLARARLAIGKDDQPALRRAMQEILVVLESPAIGETPAGLQNALCALADQVLHAGQVDEARRLALVLSGLRPSDTHILLLLGRAQAKAKETFNAIAALQTAICLDSQLPLHRRLLAQLFESAGNDANALGQWSYIIEQLSSEAPLTEDLHALAACALRLNLAEMAVKACQQALLKDGDDGLAHALLAKAYEEQGNNQGAYEHYNTATRLAPSLPEPWLALARLQRQDGDAFQALATLRAGVQAIPRSAEISLALGEAYLDDWEGHGHPAYTQALVMFQQADTNYPAEKSARGGELYLHITLRLGQTLRQLGRSEEAAQALEPAFQKDPTYPGVALAYAQTLLSNGQYLTALPVLQSLVIDTPADVSVHVDYARALLSLNVEPKKAVSLLKHALELEPNHLEAQGLLAEALLADGEFEAALQAHRAALDSSLAANPAWRTRLSLGLGKSAYALGQMDRAIAALQDAYQAGSRDPSAPRLLSEAFQTSGLYEEAGQAARWALQESPQDPDLLNWYAAKVVDLSGKGLAGTLPARQLQAYQEASEALSQAARLAPSRVDLLLNLSEMQRQAGQPAEALSTLQKIAEVEVASPDHLYQAAEALFDLQDAPKASACLERALAGAPDEPRFYPLKAELTLKAGQPSEAAACLEQAIAMQPDGQAVPEMHLRAALLYRAMGRPNDALQHLQEYLSIDGADPYSRSSIAVHLLAAGLWRAQLQPARSLPLLSSLPEAAQAAPEAASAMLAAQCLSAELALEGGNDALATTAVQAASAILRQQQTPAAGLARSEQVHLQASWMASMARLILRQGDKTAAQEKLQDALQTAITGAACEPEALDSWQALVGWHSRLACLRSVAAAALEQGEWDTAITLYQQTIKAAPEEALSYLDHGRCLALRAECQRMLEALQVSRHLPGEQAASDETRLAFEADMEATALRCPPSPAGRSTLHQWRTRGQAAFVTQPQGGDLIQTLSPAALQGITSQAVPQPLALLQAALTLVEHPERGLEAQQMAEELVASLSNTSKSGSPTWPAFYGQPPAVYNALLARTAMQLGDQTNAVAAIESALSCWPDEPGWQALAGKIYQTTGDLPAAIAHWTQAAQLEPGNYAHHLALGQACTKKGRQEPEMLKAAIASLEKAVSLEPEQVDAWLALAQAQRLSGSIDQAESCCQQAFHMAPEKAEILVLWSEVALQTGQSGVALERLMAALQLEHRKASLNTEPPESEAQRARLLQQQASLLLVQALQKMKNNVDALNDLEKALPLCGEPLPLLLERVRLLRQMNGEEAAMQALEKLASEYPDEPHVFQQLAKALIGTGEDQAIITAAQRAVQCSTVRTGSGERALTADEQADMHHLAGQLLHKTGQLDQALHHLGEAVRKQPHLIDAYLEMGLVHQERRQSQAAMRILSQASIIAPRDPRPYYQAGLALKESKDYQNAEAMLKRAAALAPNDLAIHRMLAAVVALRMVHNPDGSTANLYEGL